ncbi:MAG: NAD/NADP octopine/nopaline dehydrogenase family protein [Paramuribaculum sp.]|nr:NAD/NADP octopine/nopaline dehydrogenase family protein [Paramuribaculum sp.]
MGNIETICICGGGGQCHAIAPWLAIQGYTVNILTNNPDKWTRDFKYILPDGEEMAVTLGTISSAPEETVSPADVVIVTVPGFVNANEIKRIMPHLKSGAFVGGVFCSNGFFFDALKILGDRYPLWGFQRVPFIGKVSEYGKVGAIKAYKTSCQIAVENAEQVDKEAFRQWVETAFGLPAQLMSSYLEVTLSNSNPLLHPARISTWLEGWNGEVLTQNPLFYEEWTDDASEVYIALDADLHRIIEALPIDNECLPYVLDYYEQTNAASLSRKLRSIDSFKGIRMPVKEVEGGWLPDFSSRYFIEDFNCGLKKYVELADTCGVSVPTMRRVLDWSNAIIAMKDR